ncbi:cache domain-containing protein [Azospirillum sp. TSO22-1]|uniref:methyl-accepting chemotaxis protein n=1 Tax=Azospirillum sp. TSO22-1 TaxID=716789 RepID=UPI000D61BF82|nr:cache domain-containing protein [Azospirillum sp. TSO22-1]PWC45802.1 hypothetical protein TSO221_15525 [Azospirillum sp. TSO22-1]
MGNSMTGIRGKLLALPLLSVGALAVLAMLLLLDLRGALVDASKAQTRALVESAVTMVGNFETQAAKGAMPLADAQRMAKDALRAIRYSGNEYFFAVDEKGIAHVHGARPDFEGKSFWEAKDPKGTLFIQALIAGAQRGGEAVDYVWQKAGSDVPSPKIGYARKTAGWGWVLGTGIYVDNIDATFHDKLTKAVAVTLALVVVVAVVVLFASRSVSRPILLLAGNMQALAHGDLGVRVEGAQRRDEIGTMANAVQVFRDHMERTRTLEHEAREAERKAEEERKAAMVRMADQFEASVRGVVQAVSSAATQLQANAQSMSSIAQESARASGSVAALTAQATTDLQTVAAASEEMNSSIGEISRQVSDASRISRGAVDEAERTNASVEGLATAAQRIGDVVSLIQNIASQTNLLALNATIEAARAGEAGKGFAVVASEVKQLANQTAKATDDISAQVSEIQAQTGGAVEAIRRIGKTIADVNGISGAIAAAVEEQSAATAEIGRNVQEVAHGARMVNGTISDVSRGAAEADSAAGQVLAAARDLSGMAERLRQEVDTFIARVRTA